MVRSAPLLSRYSPAVAASTALHLAKGSPGPPALAELVAVLAPENIHLKSLVVPRARQGLLAHYLEVRERLGPGVILLPAQVCPVVPAVIRAAGLTPFALDGDGALATPSPSTYSAALSEPGVIGLLVAPMGGYVQEGWGTLLRALDARVDVGVDLAQAPLSAPALGSDLLTRADAVLFSFGVGKGFDTGGGLLLTKRTLPPRWPIRRAWPIVAEAAARSAAVRMTMALGLYRALLPLVDRMAANDVAVPAPEQADSSIARSWLGRMPVVTSEFQRAAERSARLGGLSLIRNCCVSVEATCSASARPLRQVLRLRSDLDRDAILGALRSAGLDCARGGEPFPEGADPTHWPAAYRFTRDALRLPFLGRFSDDEFERAKAIIEKVLITHGV